MRNSLETSTKLLGETVDLRVEYDYRYDDEITIKSVEIFRHAREIFCEWDRGQWVRIDIYGILSSNQVSEIRKQIIGHEAIIAKWRKEYLECTK